MEGARGGCRLELVVWGWVGGGRVVLYGDLWEVACVCVMLWCGVEGWRGLSSFSVHSHLLFKVLLCFIKPILGNRYIRFRGFIVSEPRETHPRS